MGEPTPTVRLKNGTEQARPLVAATMLRLEGMMNRGEGILVYELVQLSKNRDHVLWGDSGDKLVKLGLVSKVSDEEWKVHESIRNIVCSAVKGEGPEMCVVNPVEEKP